jgi:D-alanyl-lipoteichoic acid acyltransferase DltB (MBOAT superfamily)
MSPRHCLIWLILYAAIAAVLARVPRSQTQRWIFALLNLAFALLAYQIDPRVLLVYVLLVALHYLLSRSKKTLGFWGGVVLPVACLFSFRYFSPGSFFPTFVGFSYMVFRLSLATTEISQGMVGAYDLSDYLSFAFFTPTLAVGPISRFSTFLNRREISNTQIQIAFWRIGLGLIKYLFLGVYFSRTAFSALFAPGATIGWIDLWLASVSYYFFLYANFSGFCDIAVGLALLSGIEVDENFNSPLMARNIQDFWNRWHMTLSGYVRVILFTPLCQFLAHKMGTRQMKFIIPVALFVSFLFIGVWHGVQWNFLAFGALHGFGLVTYYTYNLWLKSNLQSEAYRRYLASPTLRFVSIAITFLFVSLSFIFFANSPAELYEMLGKFRLSLS